MAIPNPPNTAPSDVLVTDGLTEADLNRAYGDRIKPTNIDVGALVRAASLALSLDSSPSPPRAWARIFARGGYHMIYLITFAVDNHGTSNQSGASSSKHEIIARVAWAEYRHEARIRSEVATMLYISSYQPKVPVPQVYAAQYTDENPVGAPYILMSKMPGSPVPIAHWDTFSRERKDTVLSAVASIHAELARPLPFEEIGSLFLRGNEGFSGFEAKRDGFGSPITEPEEKAGLRWRIGALVSSQNSQSKVECLYDETTPGHSSLADMWRHLLDRDFCLAREMWMASGPDPIPETIHKDCLGITHTTADFAQVYRDLHALTTALEVRLAPAQLSPTGICHADFSFYRNILFDEEDRVTAVLDWDDAAVLPFVLLGRFPDDIVYGGRWRWVPEDVLSFPEVEYEDHGEWAERMEMTWNRWYYTSKLAIKNEKFSGKYWKSVGLPVKVHMCITRGWPEWLLRKKWVSELVVEAIGQ